MYIINIHNNTPAVLETLSIYGMLDYFPFSLFFLGLHFDFMFIYPPSTTLMQLKVKICESDEPVGIRDGKFNGNSDL